MARSRERGGLVVLLWAMLAASMTFAGAGPDARWIAYPYDKVMGDFTRPLMPAPVFRRAFVLDRDVPAAKLRIAGLGFYVFELDGKRVSDARLVPAPTQYDVRYRYRIHDLGALKAGRHVLSVTLGDGFYRNGTKTYWQFESASWTDYPKLSAEVTDGDGHVVLKTDGSWRVRFSPIVQNEFRAGETYDARMEFPPLETEGPEWKPVRLVPGPGGRADEERFPPCRVVATHPMRQSAETNVWISPVNLSGVPRIRVRGERGAKVVLSCGEHQPRTGKMAYGELQRDTYILKGGEVETWAPEFTYHGFDRVRVETEGAVEVLSLAALEIHTDFRSIGRIETSDELIMRLAEAGMRSALNNFVGIPTDCPHREKNGWTSEARLQCEALLYAWDVGDAYLGFVDEMTDAQRLSGQLPGMLPTGGIGYNWGSGPAWDAALACIPDSVMRFTGDRAAFDRYLPSIRRYCDYMATLLNEEGLCSLGLGDWCHSRFGKQAPDWFVTTAFYVRCLDLAGEKERAAAARRAILRRYYRGKGVFSVPASVMPALALEHSLVPEEDRVDCGRELARIVTANGARVDYGTIGSGCVLRALFDAGYADEAFEMITQPASPGYAHWISAHGLTTFPENWDPKRANSLNHGAFADVVACFYRHLAGFRHPATSPGRKFLEIRPSLPRKLADFAAEHEGFRMSWRREGDAVCVRLLVPAGSSALLDLPDARRERLGAGLHERKVPSRFSANPISANPTR